MLSCELERQILSKFPLWASEVKLNSGEVFGGFQLTGRVDYMAFEPLNMSKSLRSIEAGTIHVFEVKSCMADLKSGHGMNRVGDVNWLVCTKKLWTEIIEKNIDVSGWKPLIFGWVDDSSFNPKQPKYEPYEITGRKLPVSQALWMMLTASGKTALRGEAKRADHNQMVRDAWQDTYTKSFTLGRSALGGVQ